MGEESGKHLEVLIISQLSPIVTDVAAQARSSQVVCSKLPQLINARISWD